MKFCFPQIRIRIERWKWNKEFNMYVSNFGHFRDIHRQLIPQYMNDSGYMTIQTAHGVSLAHRVVMKTWCPTTDMDHLTVDHLDHNKRDNSIYNLEWVTMKENIDRAKRDRLPPPQEKMIDMTCDEPEPSQKFYVAYKGGNANQREFSCLLLEEAIKWLRASDNSFLSATDAKMSKGIESSVKYGKQYGKYVWRYE